MSSAREGARRNEPRRAARRQAPGGWLTEAPTPPRQRRSRDPREPDGAPKRVRGAGLNNAKSPRMQHAPRLTFLSATGPLLRKSTTHARGEGERGSEIGGVFTANVCGGEGRGGKVRGEEGEPRETNGSGWAGARAQTRLGLGRRVRTSLRGQKGRTRKSCERTRHIAATARSPGGTVVDCHGEQGCRRMAREGTRGGGRRRQGRTQPEARRSKGQQRGRTSSKRRRRSVGGTRSRNPSRGLASSCSMRRNADGRELWRRPRRALPLRSPAPAGKRARRPAARPDVPAPRSRAGRTPSEREVG